MTSSEQARLTHLLQQYAAGSLTAAEVAEMHTLLQAEGAKEWFAAMAEAESREGFTDLPADYPNWKKLWKSIAREAGTGQKTIPLYKQPWLRVAAILIFLIAIGGIIYKTTKPTPAGKQVAEHKDIAPGHDGAILTLADGRKIVLDSAGNGAIARQGATTIRQQDGQLVYRAGGAQPATVIYNTMSTPRGRQFRLVLPDGSKVWLNAASSITYPTAFTGSERQVSVAGEAYFEVAHNAAKPFIVRAGNAEVQVLGTHFDVMAYADEGAIRTTLLEGSVRFSANGRQQLLQPGQQAKLSAGAGNIQVQQVNTGEAVAWMHGQMALNNVSLAALLRQVSRWYDVDIETEGQLPQRQFGGMIDRNVNLSYVLEALAANGVHSRLEGKKLYITAK